MQVMSHAGADLGGWPGGGGGGGRTPSFSSGIRPPADPNGPPLSYFEISVFGWPTLKFFKRRLWRQYILILKGERAPKKKTQFFCPNFQKSA